MAKAGGRIALTCRGGWYFQLLTCWGCKELGFGLSTAACTTAPAVAISLAACGGTAETVAEASRMRAEYLLSGLCFRAGKCKKLAEIREKLVDTPGHVLYNV